MQVEMNSSSFICPARSAANASLWAEGAMLRCTIAGNRAKSIRTVLPIDHSCRWKDVLLRRSGRSPRPATATPEENHDGTQVVDVSLGHSSRRSLAQ